MNQRGDYCECCDPDETWCRNRVRVVSVPMYDTGIGREAGYADDAALIEAAKAQRAALSPEFRALMDALDRAVGEAFLNGKNAGKSLDDPAASE